MIAYLLCFFVLGLAFGSFANVCIYRIPKDESVIKPSSHCPSCGKHILWYDNIPVISYVVLSGRCRFCGTPIPVVYPVVEAVTAVAFTLVALKYPFHPMMPFYLVFTLALVIVSGIDYYHRIIPDVLSYGLIAMGLLTSFVNPELGGSIRERVLNSVVGTLAGGGILVAVGFAGEKIMKKEAMGGGDVKLLAGIGAILGWQKVVMSLFAASLLGSIFGLVLILQKRLERRGYIPFGPFLAVGSYASMFLPNIVDLLWVL
ncbi:MAG: prepilin peptidase [Endomicrobiales bacterium]|nr:prepilin peptidase [Endomicrobiales bacterium]